MSLLLGLALLACSNSAPTTKDTADAVPAADDADGDGFSLTDGDCDDASADVNPAASEQCDGRDEDCDGAIDDGVLQDWYADVDQDGFGDPAARVEACSAPEGHVGTGTDCDDAAAPVHPAAGEACDGVDNDCNGQIDEVGQVTAYPDMDRDLQGDEDGAVSTCDVPVGWVLVGGDCDDTDAAVGSAAREVCDGVDNDCDVLVDDADPDVLGIVNWYEDTDGDGAGDAARVFTACAAPAGWVASDDDCDDARADVHPGAYELCGGVDEDCDGLLDTLDPDVLDAATWYIDRDHDAYGAHDYTLRACAAPAGYDDDDTDCDDADASVFPGAVETPDAADDDCDGIADEGTSLYDDDGDGFSEAAGDCDDAEAAVHPGAVEICDGADNDCDALVDDADPGRDAATGTTYFADSDGDAYGDAEVTADACGAPAGFVADDTDCDDTDPTTFPGAFEPCGDGDHDCDGIDAPACESCQAIVDAGWAAGDGLYLIDPDGAGTSYGDHTTWCDMTTDGGGWTLLQRTVWDWSVSSVLLTNYSTWYGDVLGTPSPGHAYRMAGERWDDLLAGGDMMIVFQGRDALSGGTCDPLYYTGAGASLSVSASTATIVRPAGSGGIFGSADTLSATDTGPATDCANSTYEGVPWFYSHCCTTCFTFKGGYWADAAHPMASYPDTTPDQYGRMVGDVCASGDAVRSVGHEAANDLALYVR